MANLIFPSKRSFIRFLVSMQLIVNNNWKTSESELLTIFSGALLAIIPWLEKAKIKWKEGEAYNDWDNIACPPNQPHLL